MAAVILFGLNRKSVPFPSTNAPTRTSWVVLESTAVVVVVAIVAILELVVRSVEKVMRDSELDDPEPTDSVIVTALVIVTGATVSVTVTEMVTVDAEFSDPPIAVLYAPLVVIGAHASVTVTVCTGGSVHVTATSWT